MSLHWIVGKAGSRVATIKMLLCTTLHDKSLFLEQKNLHGSVYVCSLMAWEYVGFCSEVMIWHMQFLESSITSKVQLCFKWNWKSSSLCTFFGWGALWIALINLRIENREFSTFDLDSAALFKKKKIIYFRKP